ncbi:MAG: hypothetical protein EHM14_13145 [Methanothrix sp.]|nr:MAG: hypothetical protein EHM14_13145 [Methanothrix sp.]
MIAYGSVQEVKPFSGTASAFGPLLNQEKFRPGMRRCIRLVILLTVFLIFAVAFSSPVFALSHDQNAKPEPFNESTKVFMSVYVLNIGNLDVETGSYTIDFYLIMKSDKPYSIDSLEFMNGYITKLDNESSDPHEKIYRIRTQLFTNVDLQNYPFDEHKLSIEIEDETNTTGSLIYIFDEKNSGIDPDVTMVGWQSEGFSGGQIIHQYPNFNGTFSRFFFDINIRRAKVASTVKLFLPVLLVIIVSLLSLLFKGDRVSTRITVNSTMLLATVLLHFRMGEGLPPIPYLTFADQFMILTYLIMITVLVSGVLVALYAERKDYCRADMVYKYALYFIPVVTVCSYTIMFVSLWIKA